MITIGSLFSGIGGLELGLEAGLSRAGWESRTLWQVEQAEYPRAVLARQWPHAKRYTDVHDISLQNTESVDLICGGFPCQDISTAGKGAGLAGERSGLFFEMARIVRQLRPRIVVLENVSALTFKGLDVVLGTLATLGYDARWGGLRASEVGAPHRRERWFCVAWLADHDRQRGPERARLPAGSGSDRSDPDRGDGCGSSMAYPVGRAGQQCGLHPRVGRQSEPDTKNRPRIGEGISELYMGRGSAGISARLDAHRWPAPPGLQHPWEPPRTRPRQPHDRDRLRALGNAVVPQCAAVIGEWIGRELCTTSE